MEFTIRGREECVQFVLLDLLIADGGPLVTDMLIAILNTCSKEELDEASEEDPDDIDAEDAGDSIERRRVIKNKILAVGKMAKVFAVLRCVTITLLQMFLLTLIHREEAERVSELKNISASNNLPYGTLVLGSEGIKDAIQNFDDAYVTYHSTSAFY
jgi:serine/threonine-protein phosphatase 2B catalytic subunit